MSEARPPSGSTDWDELFVEEPWESSISQVLSRMESVDPPPGLFESALDRRPLFAGRTVSAWVFCAVLVTGAAVTWANRGPWAATPVSDLASTHALAMSDLSRVQADTGSVEPLPSGVEALLPEDRVVVAAGADGESDDASRFAIPGAEFVAAVSGGEQGEEMVSVYRVDRGTDIRALTTDEWIEVDGHRVWMRPKAEQDTGVAVVAGRETWLLAGLDPDRVMADARPSGPPGFGWRHELRQLATDISADLGFPQID